MKQLKNKDNSLTRYAFACGYVEKYEYPSGAIPYHVEIACPPFDSTISPSISLYKEGCYHVRSHAVGTGARSWACFNTLGAARAKARELRAVFKKIYVKEVIV